VPVVRSSTAGKDAARAATTASSTSAWLARSIAAIAAGVHTPILVPSSAAGNQMKAIEEVFAAFG